MAANPLTSRRRDDAYPSGRWRTLAEGTAESLAQLQDYAAEMTSRDPLRRKWAVVSRQDHDGRTRHFVDCLA